MNTKRTLRSHKRKKRWSTVQYLNEGGNKLGGKEGSQIISTVGNIQQYCFNYSLKHYTTQRWERNKESTVQYRKVKERLKYERWNDKYG